MLMLIKIIKKLWIKGADTEFNSFLPTGRAISRFEHGWNCTKNVQQMTTNIASKTFMQNTR
jgi:hypothetical protein